MNEPIIITGIPRSGTSLVAGIIHHCGAKSGVVGTHRNEWNPTGYWENHEIIDAVDKMVLRQLGFDVMGQTLLPGPDVRRVDIRDDVLRIAERQGIGPGDVWYFKDCKAVLLYGSWIESFPKAPIILVRRNDNDIVESCMRTPFMAGRTTREAWRDWVDHHKLLIHRMKSEHRRVMEVWYEDLVSGDYTYMKYMADHLGLEWNQKYVEQTIIEKS